MAINVINDLGGEKKWNRATGENIISVHALFDQLIKISSRSASVWGFLYVRGGKKANKIKLARI